MDVPNWIREIDQQSGRATALIEQLDEDQLNTSPAAKKWSIGELIDHLFTSNKTYFPVFESIVNGTYKNPSLMALRIIPKMLGRMVVKAVTPETKKKIKTVSIFEPSKIYHQLSVLDEFVKAQDDMKDLVRRMKDLNPEEIWIKSPASRNIIYTLSNALTIILNHEKRHLAQAEDLFKRLDGVPINSLRGN